ncbi:MAG TPA: histidine decarboxylase [Micromonosporaceae bacterium]
MDTSSEPPGGDAPTLPLRLGQAFETETIAAQVQALRARLDAGRDRCIGFPVAVDFDVSEVAPLLHHWLNNAGDPYVDGLGRAHTKDLERQIVDFLADLFHAPAQDRWGYVTSGGTEGNEYGLLLARSRYPDGVVYYSEAAHYSVAKLADRLRLPAIAVRADDKGGLRYHDLRSLLRQHRDRPAIVVASAGTTMTEAVDDVTRIRDLMRGLALRDTYVHVDAALAGIPLALLPRTERPGLDFADGADSIAVSGHKFVGCPVPCGIVITRRSLRDRIGRMVDYIGSVDSTIGGSRSGHAPLLLWCAIARYGVAGLRQRAEQSRELAAYTVNRLRDAGWAAWRHPLAFTVVLPTPPPAIVERWMLASSGGISHVICMPGMTRAQIDRFVADLTAPEVGDPVIPSQRRGWAATIASRLVRTAAADGAT